MCYSKDVDAVRLDYRPAGIHRFLSIVFISLCFIPYFLFDSFSLRDWLLSIVGIAGGIYYLLVAMRSRIRIVGTRISVRGAFKEQSADICDIELVRNRYSRYRSVTGKLLRLKGGRGTINISLLVYSLDDRFGDWLKQVPDLDGQEAE
jgi:hypothetical protein